MICNASNTFIHRTRRTQSVNKSIQLFQEKNAFCEKKILTFSLHVSICYTYIAIIHRILTYLNVHIYTVKESNIVKDKYFTSVWKKKCRKQKNPFVFERYQCQKSIL